MITLKQWTEACNYRITEGGDHGWNCFGPNAYRLDSWNGDQDGHTLSVIFDTRTQVVYQVEAIDYRRERAYRRTNPDFKLEFDAECVDRNVEDFAWQKDNGENINYTDLETDEDWMEKAQAIANELDYDERVQVPIDLPDEELFQLMMMAHKKDITLNKFVEDVLRLALEQHGEKYHV